MVMDEAVWKHYCGFQTAWKGVGRRYVLSGKTACTII